MRPMRQDSTAIRRSPVLYLVDRRSSTGRARVTTRVPSQRMALADEFLAAVGTAAGRRAAIDAAADQFLAGLGAAAPRPARPAAGTDRVVRPRVLSGPAPIHAPLDEDRFEASAARACLLALVPIGVCLRSVHDPGWVAAATGSAPGLLALCAAGALALAGSVLVWRVTSAPGRVAVVTLPAFLTCLLPAVALVLTARS